VPLTAPSVSEDGAIWYPTLIRPTVLRCMGRIATRIFFGKKYSRDIKFTDMASKYASGVILMGVFFLRHLPRFLLPIIAPFTPTMGRVKFLKEKIREDVMSYLHNSIDGSMLAKEPKSTQAKDTQLLALMVEYVQKRPGYAGANDEKILSGVIGRTLNMLFAAIDTTTLTYTHVIYDLISHPKSEYVEPIMQQIHEVLAKHGGQWSAQALGELRLLDSFVKESQRLHPIVMVMGVRKVMPAEGYTFSPSPVDPGSKPIHLHQGTQLYYPAWGVHTDPDIYPDPESFQGFRFAQDEVPSSQPNDKFMSFGCGRHACPGRYLALTVVKLMVIEFLTNYDWKVIDRPEDSIFALNLIPNRSKKVYLARKTTQEG